MDITEPTEPIDRKEPFEAIDNAEPSDHSDKKEGDLAEFFTVPSCVLCLGRRSPAFGERRLRERDVEDD
jgi:hypothetical protein